VDILLLKKIFVVLFYLLSPLLIIYLCQRFSFFNKIGAVILAYVVGLMFGALELVPSREYGASQDLMINASIALAIPFLLFSSDLRKLLYLAPKTLISLAIALFSVVLIVFVGYLIFNSPNQHDFHKVGGLLVGVYTGGTPNLAALQLMMDVKPEVYLAVHTYDMAIGTFYLFFLMSVGQKLFLKILPAYKSVNASLKGTETIYQESYRGIVTKKRILPLLIAFLSALVVLGVSGGLMSVVPEKSQMAIFILSVTAISLAVSFIKKLRSIQKTFEVGMYLILVFSVVVASKVNLDFLSNLDYNLFFYITFVVLGVLLIHALLSMVFKIDVDTVIITYTALVCSPPFVPVVAGALRNREIIVPGFTVGVIGYAIGNFLGYVMASVLQGF
jgi:uncharacterized membrane protein